MPHDAAVFVINGALVAASFGALLWRMSRAEKEIARLVDRVDKLADAVAPISPERLARNEVLMDRQDSAIGNLRESVATLAAIVQTERGEHRQGRVT